MAGIHYPLFVLFFIFSHPVSLPHPGAGLGPQTDQAADMQDPWRNLTALGGIDCLGKPGGGRETGENRCLGGKHVTGVVPANGQASRKTTPRPFRLFMFKLG